MEGGDKQHPSSEGKANSRAHSEEPASSEFSDEDFTYVPYDMPLEVDRAEPAPSTPEYHCITRSRKAKKSRNAGDNKQIS
jgi:hypothetical protein